MGKPAKSSTGLKLEVVGKLSKKTVTSCKEYFVSQSKRNFLKRSIFSVISVSIGNFSFSSTFAKAKKQTMVKLKTNFGDITINLNAEKAPATVANFLEYAKNGFYSNTIFHRVINGFMIQGGGFEPGMKQKPTKDPIKNEADNGLKNEKYTLAMARTNDPHSATAQFFINVENNEFLNFKSPTPQGWGYCVFAEVVEGKDIVDKIVAVKTSSKGFHQDVPIEDVVIQGIEII
jgi:peptidyl-prolyl cis-trans isomerase B (cyclophilin B)